MITPDQRWSLPRGNTPVPSRWQATDELLLAVKSNKIAGDFDLWVA